MDLNSRTARRALRVAAWLCLAFVAFVTVGPIGVRPVTGLSPQLERLVAFAVVGTLFAAAYPRHIFLAAFVVLGAAALLEVLQLLEPSRHGRLFDAGVKIIGGVVGLSAGWLFAKFAMRR
jgi:apolipoprotein N-acyltransferase